MLTLHGKIRSVRAAVEYFDTSVSCIFYSTPRRQRSARPVATQAARCAAGLSVLQAQTVKRTSGIKVRGAHLPAPETSAPSDSPADQPATTCASPVRSEEHTSELQSRENL